MSGIIAAGAITAAGALGKGIYGAIQEGKANRIEKNNIRPTMGVDPVYQQNVNTAEQMAKQGLPQEVINRQTEGIDQNVATGIAAASRSANPGSGISSIVRQGDLAKANLSAEDAMARNKNTLLLMQQRGQLARARQDAWNYNYADKYSENLAKEQAYRGAGAQNIIGGLTDLGTVGMGIIGNKMNGGGFPQATATAGTAKVIGGRVYVADGMGGWKPNQLAAAGAYSTPGLTTQLPN